MKQRNVLSKFTETPSIRHSLSLFLIISCSTASLKAASASWTGTLGNQWSNEANWSAAPVPTTGETATFDSAGNGNTTIDFGAGVTVKSILFDSASAAAYTLGSGAVGSQTLTLSNTGSLTVNVSVTAAQSLNAALVLGDTGAAQTTLVTHNGTSSLTIAGPVSGSTGVGTKTLNIQNTGSVLLSGSVSNGTTGTVALSKSGALTTGTGTLTLTGANTQTGTTSVSQGTLILNHTGDSQPAIKGNVSVSSFKNASTGNSGTLVLAADNQIDPSASVSFSVAGNNSSTNEFSLGGRLQAIAGLSAQISSGTGGTQGRGIIENGRSGDTGLGNGVLTINNSAAVTLGSASTAARLEIRNGGSGTLAVVKDGAGSLALNLYAAGYSGGFTLKNGAVQIGGPALGSGPLSLAGGTLSSINTTARSFPNVLKLDGDTTLGDSVNNGQLTFSGSTTLTGNRTISTNSIAAINAAIGEDEAGRSLVKSGPGTIVFGGPNTYTGTTLVSAGTLQIDGDQTSAPGILTVDANGTLGGVGIIGGPTVVGGKIAPGGTFGTLTSLDSVSLNAGSTFLLAPSDWTGSAGSGYGTLNAASVQIAATSGNKLHIVVDGASLANFSESAKTFTLATATSAVTGLITSGGANYDVSVSNFSTAPAGSWSLQVAGNALQLVYAPSTGFAAWIGGYGLSGGNALPSADADSDGLSNAIEFVVGGTPNGPNDSDKLPTLAKVSGGFEFTFRRTTAGAVINPRVEHSSDLSSSWISAVDDAGGVTITTTSDFFGPGIDKWVVFIPSAGDTHFARLAATVP